jgi:hypothetical protein
VGDGPTYISFDVDGLDPVYAPGTGRYRSREAAIVAAVSEPKRRSKQPAWLQSDVHKGLNSGPVGELDIVEIIRRGRRRVAARARSARG